MQTLNSAGPVQIVSITEDQKILLHEEKLKQILCHQRAIGKKISLISIAGDFRKGKSFMLNFFLRYLRAQDKSSWIGNEDEPLTGFDWRGGFTRHTTGINMWSEPFLVPSTGQDEIAVFLMDTQGSFDTNSTVFENVFIFSLTLLVSSITVYNIMRNIQEDNLQHLSFFAEYGVLALHAYPTSPFQQLTFLVRDWQFEYEYPCGFSGGNAVLAASLKTRQNQHHDLAFIRSKLRQCFREVNCFLMPHPGLKVTKRQDFDGRLSDIEEDFKTQLLSFVPALFSSDNENFIKQINGKQITSDELFEYFRTYCAVFAAGELPLPRGLLEATAEANNLVAKSASIEFYIRTMETNCGGDQPYIHPHKLYAIHQYIYRQSVEKFCCARRIGGEELSRTYEEDLSQKILQLYENYKKHNDSKNVSPLIRRTTTFIALVVIFHCVARILDMLGLHGLSGIFMLIYWIVFLLALLWSFTKFTGQYVKIGKSIDYFADFVWNKFFQPSYSKFVQPAMRSSHKHPKMH